MALTRLKIDGYGQIEPNHVIFTVTGNSESQCALTGDIVAENGMLLAVNKANGTVKFPQESETLPIGLNYTAERIYNQFTPGLKNFKMESTDLDNCPRIGFLSTGEIFTTNCICYDTSDYADDDTLKEAIAAAGTTAVYGTYSTIGTIKIVKTAPSSGPVLKVVKGTTMPDGQYAIKFQVQ